MTDKAHLHGLLRGIGRADLQPETYTLRDAKECREFFVRARAERGAVWVTKEPGASQGAGIVINPKLGELEEKYLKDPAAAEPVCVGLEEDEDVVVQRYIMNPLLLNKKKMEIRSYWLLASVDPLVVFYHDGTVRLTTSDYNQGDWDNPLIHITNTAQQKKADPNYYDTQTERKWTLAQLAAYLEDHKKVPHGASYLSRTLRPQLIDIIRTVVQAAHPLLLREKSKSGWDGRFELLGMDVILDDQLKVWLTEIQMGPGISRDPGVKQQTLPAMLEELTSIMLEVDQHMLKFGHVKDVNAAVTWERVI
uniref:Tubulin--tyrosine ligase-like protein 9 n=1 Tax=Arcella intermedia TaxID=1963864 RepID=A0A6B2L8F1_9EUKA